MDCGRNITGRTPIKIVEEIMKQDEYKGEEVIVNISIKKGKKTLNKEFFPLTYRNEGPIGTAICMGNHPDRLCVDLNKLKTVGQTYGCNALYRDFEPDHLLAVDIPMVKEIMESDYKGRVFTPSLQKVKYGERVHLIPNNPHHSSGLSCLHLACFHGHTKIYMIGYQFVDKEDTKTNIYKGTDSYSKIDVGTTMKWFQQLAKTMKANTDVEFILVNDNPGFVSDDLKFITYEEFNGLLSSVVSSS